MIERDKLIAYLSDLCVKYSPVCLDIAGRWVGGDEKLYWAFKGLLEEIKGWPDAMADDGR